MDSIFRVNSNSSYTNETEMSSSVDMNGDNIPEQMVISAIERGTWTKPSNSELATTTEKASIVQASINGKIMPNKLAVETFGPLIGVAEGSTETISIVSLNKSKMVLKAPNVQLNCSK